MEAAADNAGEGEDDEIDPAHAPAKAMSNGEEEGNCEGRDIDDDLPNGDAVTIGHRHSG